MSRRYRYNLETVSGPINLRRTRYYDAKKQREAKLQEQKDFSENPWEKYLRK